MDYDRRVLGHGEIRILNGLSKEMFVKTRREALIKEQDIPHCTKVTNSTSFATKRIKCMKPKCNLHEHCGFSSKVKKQKRIRRG